MRISVLIVSFAALAALAFTPARADVLIQVDKSTQTMVVTVDGTPAYSWPVSTGVASYDTPGGEFQPFRMDRDHFSREWRQTLRKVAASQHQSPALFANGVLPNLCSSLESQTSFNSSFAS